MTQIGKGNLQTLLKIRMDDAPFPQDFRSVLAKRCDLCPQFFHRDGNGNTQNGEPLIRITGWKGWVGVLATGDEGLEILQSSLREILPVVAREFGVPMVDMIHFWQRAFPLGGGSKRYLVPALVVKCRTPRRKNSDEKKLAEDVLRSSLVRTAETNAINAKIFSDPSFRIEVESVLPATPKGIRISTPEGPRMTSEEARKMKVVFSMNCSLQGHWFAGNLTSRGYGRIIPLCDEDSAKPLMVPEMDRTTLRQVEEDRLEEMGAPRWI